MLQVIRHGTGTCFWCSTDTEDGAEIQVETSKMFLCKKDFWNFLKSRGNSESNGQARQGKADAKVGNEQ